MNFLKLCVRFPQFFGHKGAEFATDILTNYNRIGV